MRPLTDLFDLTGRVAIVTGGSRGLGEEMAEGLAEAGASLMLCARREQWLTPTLEAFRKRGFRVEGAICDVSQAEQVWAVVDKTVSVFGKVDILINNAGIFNAKPFIAYTTEELDSLIGTNLKGFFHATQQAAAHMTQRKQGHIVSITASIAAQPNVNVPAALPILIKGGINHATKALALELAPYNIKVNAVAPGIIDTPLYTSDMHSFLNTMQPAGHIGSIKDVTDAVLYLTDAEFTTGIVLPVDGGMASGKW